MPGTFKRFYSDVGLATRDGGWRLELDGKPAKTPAGRELVLAYHPLAEQVAEEWRRQGNVAQVAGMPMTRLAMSVIDHGMPRRAAMRAEALKFGETDLLCYRAEEPRALAERQAAAWQEHLDWAAARFGASLEICRGLVAHPQRKASLAALAEALDALDPWRLLIAHALTFRFGSLVLALAVVYGQLDARQAFETSRLEEIFQAETWGGDHEAEKRTAAIAAEVEDLGRFLSLLK
jgi:chaperone required for assembly of F1-ATPase